MIAVLPHHTLLTVPSLRRSGSRTHTKQPTNHLIKFMGCLVCTLARFVDLTRRATGAMPDQACASASMM